MTEAARKISLNFKRVSAAQAEAMAEGTLVKGGFDLLQLKHMKAEMNKVAAMKKAEDDRRYAEMCRREAEERERRMMLDQEEWRRRRDDYSSYGSSSSTGSSGGSDMSSGW